MTTIAYRDGIMAADTRAFAGYNSDIGQKRKIHRLADGTLIGISTNRVGISEQLLAWYRSGADPKDGPAMLEKKFTILVVKPDGGVFFANEEFAFAGPLTSRFFAIGSGDGFALGAMAMGATAKQAVAAACGLDVWSALPIMTLSLVRRPG